MAKKSSTTGKVIKREAGKKVSDQLSVISVRELAWTGQHAQAIEVASQALSGTGLKPVLQMDLLDLRAESYIAIGNLDLALKDAKAMGKIGRTSKVKGLDAQALNRLALVQMRTGDLKGAMKSATSAVKTKHTHQQIRAQSLLILSEAQMRPGDTPKPAIENAHKAIALFQTADNFAGIGRAYWSIALAKSDLGDAEESRRACFTALEYCQRAGDQYGIGNAYNALTFTDADLAERRQHSQLALEAFSIAGYQERIATCINNLSLIYAWLGLYLHQRRLALESLDMYRAMGVKTNMGNTLAGLSGIDVILGNLPSARAYLHEFSEMVPTLNDSQVDLTLASALGDLALAEGDSKKAVRLSKSAAQIAEKEYPSRQIQLYMQLGIVHLADQNPAAALKATTKSADIHRSQNFAFINNTAAQSTWWWHTQALNANGKTKEAREALERAYGFLLETIKNIRDEGLRRNALNKVEDNRKLLQYWVKDGAKRKLPKERLFAHLNIESNIREPFKRLADTGLRLNALHTIDEIQHFLVEEATELIGGERVMLILERSADFSRQVKEPTKVGTTREVVESILPLPSYFSGKGYEKAEDPQKVLKGIEKYLDQARKTRTVQLITPPSPALPPQRGKGAESPSPFRRGARGEVISRVIAPLIAQNQVIGYLYTDMDTLYGTFDSTDRDMMGMLANQAAVALDNAGLLQGLEQKVADRTAQLQEHISELQIINSIQQGLAAELDFQAIVDLVGDKLREVFNTPDLGITWYDEKANLVNYLYYYEHGKRMTIPSRPPNPGGIYETEIKTRQPLVLNSVADYARIGGAPLPGTDQSKSLVSVPIISSDRFLGDISMENYERENAYGESELRLLTTIAASLGTALENARLFDETQRLFKAEQERVAELQIINSIQQGLAAELDFQAIVDLVGDKLREVFNTPDMSIRWYAEKANLLHYFYTYEHGKRFTIAPLSPTPGGLFETMRKTRQPIVLNTLADLNKINAPLLPGTDQSKSSIYVPIISSDRILGYISTENYERENAYGESELRLLTTIAASLGTALENARLFDETQRLLKITEERNAELAIINRTSQALTQELDLRSLVDLVGDKLRTTLKTENIGIGLYDKNTNMLDSLYVYKNGERVHPEPTLLNSFNLRLARQGKPLVLNTVTAEQWEKFGSDLTFGADIPKSVVMIPLLAGGGLIGGITLQSFQAENAYPDSMVRLLETIASNMGTAIQNARLFEETQRLLKQTEERNAELAVINSIQQGIAGSLDFHGIVELVGNKLTEVLQSGDIGITWTEFSTHAIKHLYDTEHGIRLNLPDEVIAEDERWQRFITRREPIVMNSLEEQKAADITIIPGTDQSPSFVQIPMIASDRRVGGIVVENYERENAFGESEVRLLQTIASSLGVALQSALNFDETQRLLKITEERAAELAAISTVTQALVAETDLDNMIQLIGSQTREIFNADIAYLALLDPQTEMIQFPYQHGEEFNPLKLGEGLTSKIIQSGEPLILNEEISRRTQEIGATRVGKDALSYLGVPIKAGRETIGVISVQSTTEEGRFNNDSLRLLNTIAANAGSAIRTTQLHNETQRRAKEMAILAEIGSDIAATRELEPVLEKIAAHAVTILNVRDIAVVLREPESDIFRASVVLGGNTEETKSVVITLKTGIMGSILESGVAEFVNDPSRDPRVYHIPGTPEEDDARQYMMGAPLISRGNTIGGIMVWRERPDNLFTQADLDFLVSVARQTAIAIESARLYLETQRRAREMSALVEVGRDISSSLESSTVLEGIAKHARDLLNSDTSALFLPEGDGTVFRAIAAVGDIADELRNETIAWGEGILGSIAKNKIGEIVNDANNDPRAVTVSGTEDIADEHIMAAPLLANDEIKGLMAVWRTGKGLEFTDFELEFLNNLSRQAVIAVQNAQHFTEAEELRVAAETANHAKSAFMANMSHELRTPLNAIIGFTRIVRRKAEGVLAEKQTENLDKVLASGEHLLGLINTVLDIAKIEAGRMDVQASNFNASALIDQCANLATPLLKPAVTLEKQVDESIGLIHSDQDKIKQIVLNLLSNAAKFTHAGKIVLKVESSRLKVEDATLNIKPSTFLRIHVTDSGIGISEEALGRVFEEFQQADTSTTRQYGGTGLGLAISRNLAKLLGGDLTATSELGKGSTFTLTVPMQYGSKPAVASAPEKESQPKSDSAKKQILVIDDDPDADYLLQESLGHEEFQITGARNGHDGLSIAREKQPHAILLDILMPETDGWQILHDLKADPVTTNIPVILLTIVDKKALGFRLGAAAYLLKPLDPSAVVDALNRVTGKIARAQKNILVVDDDPLVVDMLRQSLPESDFKLDAAEDGEAGLQAITANRPDVILLDLMMPKLDGFGVIEQLRANAELRNIPVIVISAKELTDDEAIKLKESVAFVMKKQGFDGAKLAQEINSVLEK